MSKVTQEWDSAWDSDDDGTEPAPSGERNRLSLEEERRASEVRDRAEPPASKACGYPYAQILFCLPSRTSKMLTQKNQIKIPQQTPDIEDEDDGADAWGWGDDDDDAEIDATAGNPEPTNFRTAQESEPINALKRPSLLQNPSTREMTLSERYWISSIPQPVFNSVKKLYDDAAELTQPESVHPFTYYAWLY